MKIVAPVDGAAEVKYLAKAGADELFFGFTDDEWRSSYSNHFPSGQRNAPGAALRNFEEVKALAGICAEVGVRPSLAINAEVIVGGEIDRLLKIIEKCISLGVNTFLVADLGLMAAIQRAGIPAEVHLSSIGMCLNYETFLVVRDLGVKRIILPQHITLKEAAFFCEKVRPMEVEGFIFDERCYNMGGLCGFVHGFIEEGKEARNACRFKYSVAASSNCGDACEEERERLNKYFMSEREHASCGICAAYDFKRMGMSHVKISGRGKPLKAKVQSVFLVKKVLGFMKVPCDRDTFTRLAIDGFRSTWGRDCEKNCYY